MKTKWASLIFLTLLPVYTVAQDMSTLTYCYGGQCSSAPPYNGPMVQYENSGSGSSSDLNQKAYEAYRYGKLKELEAYRSEVEFQRISFEKKLAEQQGLSANLDLISQRVHEELLTTYPSPSSEVVDESLRRKLNPLPEGLTESQVQSQLNPLWNEAKKSDPIGVIRELSRLQSQPQGEHKTTLQRELQISQITDSKGLLKAPYAQTPKQGLTTGLNTIEGQQVRQGINKILATESLMGARCANSQLSAECIRLHIDLQAQVAAFYLLDRIISEQSEGMNPVTVALMSQLQGIAEYHLGVAVGVVSGTISFAEGLAQIIRHPVETTLAFAHALTHLPSTYKALKEILISKGDEFLNGDAYTRGKIVGEATVLIASILMPAGEMTVLLEGTVFLKTGVALSLAEVSTSLGMATKLSAASLRSTVLVERLGATGARAEQIALWGEKYLAGKDGDLLTSALSNSAPERIAFLELFETSVAGTASREAIEYVVGQVAFEKVIYGSEVHLDKAKKIAEIYDSIAPKLKNLPEELIQPQVVEGTRAIPKTWTDNMGAVHINTKSDVMRTHNGGLYASHRFSRPGQNMLYVSTGKNASRTALAEINSPIDDAILASRTFELKKPLDLRNDQVIENLKIDKIETQLASARKDAYIFTQVIGELAERQGFDSIIFNSSKDLNETNVGILKNHLKERP